MSREEHPEIMDIKQASAYLQITSDTLYNYVSHGLIPAFKLGNRWRFKKLTLDEWIDEQIRRKKRLHDTIRATK